MVSNAFNKYDYNTNLNSPSGDLHRNMMKSKECLWNYVLKNKQLKGYQFCKKRSALNYIADFICKELMLIIEIDGIIHDAEVSLAEDERPDGQPTNTGFQVIRFSAREVLSNIAGVVIAIEESIARIEKSVRFTCPQTEDSQSL